MIGHKSGTVGRSIKKAVGFGKNVALEATKQAGSGVAEAINATVADKPSSSASGLQSTTTPDTDNAAEEINKIRSDINKLSLIHI